MTRYPVPYKGSRLILSIESSEHLLPVLDWHEVQDALNDHHGRVDSIDVGKRAISEISCPVLPRRAAEIILASPCEQHMRHPLPGGIQISKLRIEHTVKRHQIGRPSEGYSSFEPIGLRYQPIRAVPTITGAHNRNPCGSGNPEFDSLVHRGENALRKLEVIIARNSVRAEGHTWKKNNVTMSA